LLAGTGFIPLYCVDLRVLVLGGQCLAAMERHGTTWKTNIANEAVPVSCVPLGEVRFANRPPLRFVRITVV